MQARRHQPAGKNLEAIRRIIQSRAGSIEQPEGPRPGTGGHRKALAHLQLGRALVLSGDKAKARIAYQDFLTLWKDADPDIPVLKQARAEYANLP